MSTAKSILVIEASGEIGVQIIRLSKDHDQKPKVHAFVRNKSSILYNDQQLCTSIQEGDARNIRDVKLAIKLSKCNTIIVTSESGSNNNSNANIRKTIALLLIKAVQQCRLQHYIDMIVISSIGAGSSTVPNDLGFGLLNYIYFKKKCLADCTRQEQIFKHAYHLNPHLKQKLLVIRPTVLTNNNKFYNTGHVHVTDNDQQLTCSYTNRKDLAHWLLNEACSRLNFGKVLHVTSEKR